ncbi:hypothetical protein [Novosphingobium jiangmenense]|uniref:VanZ-like domain-containing protein n=1 Tax=Novosphingobium jiangmenense TaxID=2791981 RepID=A0ABS0HEV2_9SPHN|nr:hypothetical protein [Novosphingobium jiangmenense]MBF9150703.1 hypothetical protein [Novosphingobium jiangmenense]
MQRFTDLLSRVARFTFWPALAFALVMAVLPKPPSLPIDDLGDKFAHMLAFFTLSLLAGVGWPKASLVRAALWLSLIGAGIEVVQMIPFLHRDSDWRDWVADSAAILVALIPVTALRMIGGVRTESAKA